MAVDHRSDSGMMGGLGKERPRGASIKQEHTIITPSGTSPARATAAQHDLIALAPRGLEELVARELAPLGATDIEVAVAHVRFAGTLECAYRACLWSRAASRVLLPLARFKATTPDELYAGVRTIDWDLHLGVTNTLAVDAVQSRSTITHTNFAALKVKDAIVDLLRERHGARPSVDPHNPDVRINLALRDDLATLSIDLAGRGLHRRGWRGNVGTAPLKENLAAALLLLADWPDVLAAGGGFVDPLCGSGTLLVEAALIAADVAPGINATRFGFEGWRGHDNALYERLKEEARRRDRRRQMTAERHAPGGIKLPPIVGYDRDPNAIRAALENIRRAGLVGLVHAERRELAEVKAAGKRPGLVVVNPPYGQRLGRPEELPVLYRRLGDTLKQGFPHWIAHILTSERELAKYVGLKATRRRIVYNGPLECRLLEYPITPSAPKDAPDRPRDGAQPDPRALGGPVIMFANRLKKNMRRLRSWRRGEQVSCYRLYDADLPEYAVSIDIYERFVVVREHDRPESVDKARAVARLNDALRAVEELLGVPSSDIFLKRRRRRKEGQQYEKLDDSRRLREVREGGHRFLVNLQDYFDTGLFLDHRGVRALIERSAKGKRFLNLFAYTGTASIYAAAGGAKTTTSVDLSNTYLEWAQQNFALNGYEAGRDGPHRLVRADCLRWLAGADERYDLIFLDPPTFSRSKGMITTFDVQRDHVSLIKDTARLLTPGGELLFSTNARRFKLDEEALAGFAIENLTRPTMPPDFARSPRIHAVWRLRRR